MSAVIEKLKPYFRNRGVGICWWNYALDLFQAFLGLIICLDPNVHGLSLAVGPFLIGQSFTSVFFRLSVLEGVGLIIDSYREMTSDMLKHLRMATKATGLARKMMLKAESDLEAAEKELAYWKAECKKLKGEE
jgi:hypothetical protein